MEQDQNIDNVAVESVEQAPQAPQQTEKMLAQSEVNKIVGRAKAEAEQRTRRQLEEQYQQQLEAASRQQQEQRVETGHQQQDADSVYQQVQERFNEEMRQRQMQQELTHIANQYYSKMDAAKQTYKDFDDVTKRFDPNKFPELVYLVAGLENGGDVIYELAKNPNKLISVNMMARDAPEFAQDELQKLSASIKANQQAQQEATGLDTNAPLDRLQPSRAAGSNGKPSIRDLRTQPWLRG